MVVGENGVLNRATDASRKTNVAKDEEARQMSIAEAAMNFENTEYEDKNGEKVTIPAGFAVSQVEGENTVEDGLVIIDSKGNEFVWIPITNADSYVRNISYPADFDLNTIATDSGYLPTLSKGKEVEGNTEEEKEIELVTQKGGFYISRYEAGDGSTTTLRTNSSGISGQLVSKKGTYIYNWISQTDAKLKAKTFIDNANVKSGLTTGIQWDMVMNFINNKNDAEKNLYDVTNESSARHTNSLAKSGQNDNDKICNIYDLEGNCREYVPEKSSDMYVVRGGYWGANSASYRDLTEGIAYLFCSFRITLYIM